MLRQFYMNGDLWKVRFVSPHDSVLFDRTGQRTLAVSDYSTMIIYGLLPELHRMVKKRYWVEAEEFVCNMLADYGCFVIGVAKDVLGNRFTYVAPVVAERMIA